MRLVPCYLLLTLLLGCMSSPTASEQTMLRREIFFGLSRPEGGMVSDAEFEQFVAQEIATRFPDGFTLMQAEGRWREEDGDLVKEPSRVLIIFADAKAEPAIDALCEAYRVRFKQEAVLESTIPTKVEFIDGGR